MRQLTLLTLLFIISIPTIAPAQKDRATQVKDDHAKFNQDDFWHYNDLNEGLAKAKKTGQPLLVVFR